MSAPAYHCEKCKLAVIVMPGQKPIRACKCAYAAIIANCSATVTSHNLVKQA